MGRLTKYVIDEYLVKDFNYTSVFGMDDKDYLLFCDVVEKLAHYEDMEEQGRLIEQSYSYVNTIVGKMGVMHQECSKCNEGLEWKAYPNYCPNCGAKMFATKEEAEAKLKEMEETK